MSTVIHIFDAYIGNGLHIVLRLLLD
jgi:hypothetical protein